VKSTLWGPKTKAVIQYGPYENGLLNTGAYNSAFICLVVM